MSLRLVIHDFSVYCMNLRLETRDLKCLLLVLHSVFNRLVEIEITVPCYFVSCRRLISCSFCPT